MLTYVSVLHRYRALLQRRVGVKLRSQNNLLTDFLAHLSRRLTGELIVYMYPCSGVRPSVVRHPSSSTISKIFFSETAWPIKLKFYGQGHRLRNFVFKFLVKVFVSLYLLAMLIDRVDTLHVGRYWS